MKRRIGITQRVEVVSAYGERRDCLDQKWFTLLEALDLIPVPIPNSLNDPSAYLEQSNLDGFILSGGNDLVELPGASNPAPERDALERLALGFAQDNHLPVLGVCRGMQMINTFLGGHLVKVKRHVARRHIITPVAGTDLFLESKEVNSFHAWGITTSSISECLHPAAIAAEDGSVEAFCCQHLPWLGIMWHPERETPSCIHDMGLIKKIFGV